MARVAGAGRCHFYATQAPKRTPLAFHKYTHTRVDIQNPAAAAPSAAHTWPPLLNSAAKRPFPIHPLAAAARGETRGRVARPVFPEHTSSSSSSWSIHPPHPSVRRGLLTASPPVGRPHGRLLHNLSLSRRTPLSTSPWSRPPSPGSRRPSTCRRRARAPPACRPPVKARKGGARGGGGGCNARTRTGTPRAAVRQTHECGVVGSRAGHHQGWARGDGTRDPRAASIALALALALGGGRAGAHSSWRRGRRPSLRSHSITSYLA